MTLACHPSHRWGGSSRGPHWKESHMGFTIFVSHATEDAPLVHALQTLIEDTLDEVTVRSSSSRPARGGIEPGSSWLEWIYESVANSDATLLILTSASYDRPWLLWE